MSTAIAQIPHHPTPPQFSVARTRKLTKTYGSVTALRNIDFELRRGELLALLGPNGA